jgi:hypothetical protein
MLDRSEVRLYTLSTPLVMMAVPTSFGGSKRQRRREVRRHDSDEWATKRTGDERA